MSAMRLRCRPCDAVTIQGRRDSIQSLRGAPPGGPVQHRLLQPGDVRFRHARDPGDDHAVLFAENLRVEPREQAADRLDPAHAIRGSVTRNVGPATETAAIGAANSLRITGSAVVTTRLSRETMNRAIAVMANVQAVVVLRVMEVRSFLVSAH